MAEEKYVEVDGQKFVDDGEGNAKVGDDGQPIPFVEEQTVPYKRFKDVNEAKKDAEQKLQTLEKKGETLTPEQQKEKQARDYLKGLVKDQLAEEAKAKKAEETQEQKNFDSEVDDILAVNSKVDREEFLKFIEDNSDKYAITNVTGAMELYKDLGKIKSDTAEETKDNLANKPNLPKSEGTAEIKQDLSGDKNKTLQEITEEAMKEAEAKGRK